MCLGIPGRVVGISDADRKLATVDVLGVRREVSVACIAEETPLADLVGAWVLIHVGFAMARIDEEEARKTIEALRLIGMAQNEVATIGASRQVPDTVR